MLDKVITSLIPNYHELKRKRVFLFLFVLALLIRFPFFFRDYVDLDESTFILVGQSWLDGHLPYTLLWDLKPPLAFLFFAGVIAVFGKSFIAIRAAGTLVVALGAFFLYAIGTTINTKKVGIWSAIFYVILSSLFGSLQGVMSEHLSMFFFLGGLYLLINTQRLPLLLVSGTLFGCALMTKLNLSYAVLLLVLGLFYFLIKKNGFRTALISMIGLGLGILIPVALLYLLYASSGFGEVWWQSVIQASLAYGEVPFSERLDTIIPIIVIALLIVGFVRWNKRTAVLQNNQQLALLLLAVAGILFSFYKVGKINGHYLIQLYPFLILLLFSFILHYPISTSKWFVRISVFLLLLVPMESYLEYYAIAKNYSQHQTLFNGEGIDVPKYLVENELDSGSIWFLEFHIGYWVLGQKPITKATTHPSNLMRDQLFTYMENDRKTSLDELKYILHEKAPKIIVTKGARIPFNADHKEEVYAYFAAYLNQHYSLIEKIGKATVYKRLD